MQKRVELAMRSDFIKEDRVSNLPEHIKQHIISYLNTKEAAATAVLSSSWKNVWLTHPCLRLDRCFLSSYNNDNVTSHEQLLNSVDRLFTRRRSTCTTIMVLEKLKLHVPSLKFTSTSNEIPESLVNLLNKIILRAVNEFRVKNLDFSIGQWEDYNIEDFEGTNLPITSFSYWNYDVINALKLRGCRLNSPVQTSWVSLRCLSLKHVNLNQEIIDSFTSNCKLLQSLRLLGCTGGQIDTLHASCLKRLVTLHVTLFGPHKIKKVELDNPKLEFFLFYDISRGGAPCVIHDIMCSKGLIKLDVSNAILTDVRLRKINFGHFPKLKKLSLVRCYGLKCVKISNNLLKKLRLIYTCTPLPLEEVEIMDAPALHNLYVSPGNPTVKLHWKWLHQNVNDLEFGKFVKFLGNFFYSLYRHILDHLEVHVNESLPSDVVSYYVVPPDIRKSTRSPLLGGFKDLKLSYIANFWKEDDKFEDLVNGLLWLAPRPNTVIIELFDQRKNVVDSKELKFEYTKEYDKSENCEYCEALPIKCVRHLREKCDYCETLPLRCWRHNLDKVTILNKLGRRTTITSKHDYEAAYFFKNARKSKNVEIKIVYD